MPVTTVPCPATVNERSIAIRKRPGSVAGLTVAQADWSARLSSGKPAPVAAEVRTIAAPSKNVPRTSPRISSSTRSSQDGSTRSHLVRAMTPEDRPSNERICMCSFVCGMTESSAATTSMARSRPEAPASMLRMNRSWPGTSIRASLNITQLERREAQVDRDAALLLGRQAIGVDACQGVDQGGLAVVDVAGGTED